MAKSEDTKDVKTEAPAAEETVEKSPVFGAEDFDAVKSGQEAAEKNIKAEKAENDAAAKEQARKTK